MPDREPDFRPAGEWSAGRWLLVLLVLLVAGFFGWRWWQERQADQQAMTAPAAEQPPQPDEAPAAASTPQGPQNPVEALGKADAALPALDNSDARLHSALAELLGSKNAPVFLQTDGFVRRAVATVDNLPREHASVHLWPVRPTGGALRLSGQGDGLVLNPDNGARYTPFVLFAESIDSTRAAALYVRLYPLFQQAYEELGYPGRYFNDRLVAVIDHLLATPDPAGPVHIRRVEIKSDDPGGAPSLHYEFADPQLEALSAGQKLLLRMGPVNERRLKAKLREFRAQVAAARPPGG